MGKKKKEIIKQAPPVNVYGEAISFATDSFRAGISEAVIVEALVKANDKFTPENLQFIINRSSLEIANEHARDRQSIVALHTKRYNAEAKKAMEDKHLDIAMPHIRRQFRIQSLELALNALQAKERVLQIHAKETQVKIFNRLNAKIKERKIAYDLSTLTLDEKIDFLALVQKAKRSNNEMFSIILKPKSETVDIEHEEVKADNNNIALIEQVNIPAIEEAPIPQVKINDLMGKLRATLEKKAKMEFDSKGAKELAPNAIDLRRQALK